MSITLPCGTAMHIMTRAIKWTAAICQVLCTLPTLILLWSSEHSRYAQLPPFDRHSLTAESTQCWRRTFRLGTVLPSPLALYTALPTSSSMSALMPQPKTKLDSAWKWARITMACTTSDKDQLFFPLVSFCKRKHGRAVLTDQPWDEDVQSLQRSLQTKSRGAEQISLIALTQKAVYVYRKVLNGH